MKRVVILAATLAVIAPAASSQIVQTSSALPPNRHAVAAPATPAPVRPGIVETTAAPGFGDYAYDGSGNIIQAGPRTYLYDKLGRLSSVTNGTVTENAYTYDRHGNLLTITTTSVNASNVTSTDTTRLGVNPKTNRIDQNSTNGVPNTMVAIYDAYGNITYSPTGTFVYDQFNMPKESTVGGLRTLYLYSASDERIASIHPSYVKEFWTIRDPGGRVLRRMDRTSGTWSWSQDYIYGAGRLIAAEIPGPAKTLHYHADHLGTPRLITGNAGVQVGRHDYYPFGLEIASGTNDGERLQFTGHERDAATLDYMHARYYDGSMGRFLSVDPTGFWDLQHGSDEDRAKFRHYLRHPQRWNRYAYVSNNPINKIDPDGREEHFYLERLFREQHMVGAGTMTEEQYWARRRSEGYGGLIGTGGAGGWLLGVRAVTAGVSVYQAWRAASAAATTIKLIEKVSSGDARIFRAAMNYARGTANTFMSNLTALSRAVEHVVGPQGRITQIGTINGQAVWGSARTGFGIVDIDGVTNIVQMIGDDKYRLIGTLR
jgi:RHS repeat-associated protein